MAGPLTGGWGLKGRDIKEKIIFLEPYFSNVQNFNGHKARGGLGLNSPAIKRINFFAASLRGDAKKVVLLVESSKVGHFKLWQD